MTNVIRHYVMQNSPVRIDAPAGVSLFTYDNGTFIVQSFLHEATKVNVSVAGEGVKMHAASADTGVSGEPDEGLGGGRNRSRTTQPAAARTRFSVTLQPHSYRIVCH